MKIDILGSCRVDTPLREAAKAGQIEFASNMVVGFIHSPREIIQAIKLLRGQLGVPPKWLQGLMSVVDVRPLGSEKLAGSFEALDAIVLEVSSVREMALDGYSLQINKLREHLIGFPTGADLVANLARSDHPWRLARERAVEAGGLAETDLHLLQGLVRFEHSAETLRADLESIVAMLPCPILFVSHFAEDFNGKPIAQRALICDALKDLAASNPRAGFFDPTPHVAKAGRETALLDLGHYKPEYQPVVTDLLVDALSKLQAR